MSTEVQNTTSASMTQNCLLPAVSFNLVWDADTTVDNDFRSWLLGKPIYDMHCNSCMSFIGAYHKPEDCSDRFCPKCGQSLRNGG